MKKEVNRICFFTQQYTKDSLNLSSKVLIFRRLKADGPFHDLFGWCGALRIFFFSSEMTINWLLLKKILCLLCNSTQAADNNKVLSEENKELFEKILKTANFVSFWEQNQTTIITSFYPKSSWNRLFADSLGKLWL